MRVSSTDTLALGTQTCSTPWWMLCTQPWKLVDMETWTWSWARPVGQPAAMATWPVARSTRLFLMGIWLGMLTHVEAHHWCLNEDLRRTFSPCLTRTLSQVQMLREIGVFSNQISLLFMMLAFCADRFDICVSFWFFFFYSKKKKCSVVMILLMNYGWFQNFGIKPLKYFVVVVWV